MGKTLVSAVLCEALGADYWKPVLSGTEDGPADDDMIVPLLEGGSGRVHPSAYRFRLPLSPHAAAAAEGREVALDTLVLPSAARPLVVELAGGVLVPLSDWHTNMDLMARFALPVIVVSRHYLGSINHTLLTLEALRGRGIGVAGVVFNGSELADSERIITRLGQVRAIGSIPEVGEVSAQAVRSLTRRITLPRELLAP